MARGSPDITTAKRRILRRDPTLSENAVNIIVGQSLSAGRAGAELARTGRLSAQTAQNLPVLSTERATIVEANAAIEFHDVEGGESKFRTIRINPRAGMSAEEFAEFIFSEAESMAETYGFPLRNTIISYEILGVYGV